jgi:hypothetical protein
MQVQTEASTKPVREELRIIIQPNREQAIINLKKVAVVTNDPQVHDLHRRLQDLILVLQVCQVAPEVRPEGQDHPDHREPDNY